jgi:hypothetical protein
MHLQLGFEQLPLKFYVFFCFLISEEHVSRWIFAKDDGSSSLTSLSTNQQGPRFGVLLIFSGHSRVDRQ